MRPQSLPWHESGAYSNPRLDGYCRRSRTPSAGRRGHLPRARERDLRLRRARLVRGAQAARDPRPRAGRRGRRGRRRGRRACAPGDVVAIHHHAAVRQRAGSAPPGTRRCARSSAPRGWTRAASPSTCASSASWSASCCRSTASIPSRATCTEPLACALRAQDRVGLGAARRAPGRRRRYQRPAPHRRGARPRRRAACSWPSRARDRRERALAWGAAVVRAGRAGRRRGRCTSHHPEAIAAAAAALGPGGRLLRLRAAGAGRADRGRRRRALPARADRHGVVVRRRRRHARGARAAPVGRAACGRADHAPLRGSSETGARAGGAARRERAQGGRAAVGRA